MQGVSVITVAYIAPTKIQKITINVTSNSTLLRIFEECCKHFGIDPTTHYLNLTQEMLLPSAMKLYSPFSIKLHDIRPEFTTFEIKKIPEQQTIKNVSQTKNTYK